MGLSWQQIKPQINKTYIFKCPYSLKVSPSYCRLFWHSVKNTYRMVSLVPRSFILKKSSFLDRFCYNWVMDLRLGANSKSEAIFLIKGRYRVEIGYFLYFSLTKQQTPLDNMVAMATSWVPGKQKLQFQMPHKKILNVWKFHFPAENGFEATNFLLSL